MCSFSLIFYVNNAFIVPNKSVFYIHECTTESLTTLDLARGLDVIKYLSVIIESSSLYLNAL